MGIVLTEGFDMYNGVTGVTSLEARWTLVGNGGHLASLGTGRWFGGQCLTIVYQGLFACVQKLFLGGNYSSLTVGCGFRVNTTQLAPATEPGDLAAGSMGGIRLNAGTTNQIYIRANENNGLDVYRLNVLLGSTVSGSFVVGTWHYLEIECVISNSVGRVTLYLDGEQVLNLTGQDTQNHATFSYVDNLTLGYGGSVNGGNQLFNLSWDDIYISNSATRLGECRIETLRPDSDYSIGWSPDTGSVNYSRVNETLASASNYVGTNVVGTRDLYGIDNLAVNPETIYAVNAVSFAKKTDATTRVLSNSIQSNGTDAYGPNNYLNASDNRYDSIYETNPDGSVAWTYSSVNALKAGPKIIS